MNPLPQNWQSSIFYNSSPFERDIYFQRVLIWLHLLKQILKQVELEDFLKNADVSTTIAAAKMDLLVELLLAISR